MVTQYLGKAIPPVADGRDDHMNQDSGKAATLRSKIDVHRPVVAMAAHNPLAAKLAAGAGFDAIWGSGFELSASYARARCQYPFDGHPPGNDARDRRSA